MSEFGASGAKKAARVRRRLVISLLVLLASVLLGFWGLHSGVDIQPVEFTTPDDVIIRGRLVSPEGCSSELIPAAVFCHGLGASRDIYLYGIRRLSRSGMRVLAIDLRGHGRSEGFSDFGNSESLDALSGVDYLLTRHDVDPGKIALLGHSLGGITVTRAGCRDAGAKVRAVASIYCWLGFQDAVESIFGPLEHGFIGNLWPSFAWNHTFPLKEEEIRARDVLPMTGPDRRPPNYLLIHATSETLINQAKAERLLARAAGKEKIEPDVKIGDFGNLTARRLALVKGNHATEAVSPSTYREIEKWLAESMDSKIIHAGFDAGMLMTTTGMLVAIAAVLYIYTLIRLWFSLRIQRTENKHIPDRRPLWQAVVVSVILVALSAPAFRLAPEMNTPLMVRTWLGDVLCVYALFRIMLSSPFLVILALICRGRFTGFWKSLIPGIPSRNCWGLGLAPTIWLMASLALTGLFLWIPPAMPKDTIGFIILFTVLFVYYLIEEGAFRGIILPGAGVKSTRGQAAVTGLVGGMGLSAAFISCFPSLTYAIDMPEISVPMLPVVLIIFPAAYYAHSALSSYLFRRTGNILVPAVSMAFLLAWLFTTFGVRAA